MKALTTACSFGGGGGVGGVFFGLVGYTRFIKSLYDNCSAQQKLRSFLFVHYTYFWLSSHVDINLCIGSAVEYVTVSFLGGRLPKCHMF